MAYQQNLELITRPANADLSAGQYFLVKISNSSGTGRVAFAGAGERAIGVLQNKPDAAGKAASVAVGQVVKVSAGGSITAGNEVTPDSSGEAVVAGSGDIVFGVALNSAVDGDIVEIVRV